MKQPLLLTACVRHGALAALATLALLAGSAGATGINLSWNDCGTAGQASQTFACNTNTGAPLTMIASFEPPANVPLFLGIAVEVDLTTGTPTIPDWWKLSTGECRSAGLATSFDFTAGPFTCTDFYAGQAAGGFAYDSGFNTPNRGRLRIQAAVPFDNRGPVDPATEYYAVKVNLLRAKTTGTGACTGCDVEACIVLNSIQLFQPPEQNNDPMIDNSKDRNWVTWQSTTVANCPQSTPTRSSTWGAVKSLYR